MTTMPTDEQRNSDPDFFDKAYKLVDIVSSWLAPRVPLERASILDFGCGHGETALGFAIRYPEALVFGIDLSTDEDRLRCRYEANVGQTSLPENLRLLSISPGEFPDFGRKFSAIYSWSVIEHVRIDLLPSVLAQLNRALADDGYIFIQIAPLFYSAFGHHVSWTPEFAWSHLTGQCDLFDAQLIQFAGAPAKISELRGTYETLNRLTAEELRHVLEDAGFFIEAQYRTLLTEGKPARTGYAFRSDVVDTEQVVLVCSKAPARTFERPRLTRGKWGEFARALELSAPEVLASSIVEQCNAHFGSLDDYAIFEACSGDGRNAQSFERSGAYVLGVEPNEARLTQAVSRRNAAYLTSKFIRAEPEDMLEQIQCRFDLVVLNGDAWEAAKLWRILNLAVDRTDRIYAEVRSDCGPSTLDVLAAAGFCTTVLSTTETVQLAAKRGLRRA